MRRELAKKENERARFTGSFVRFGTKNGWHDLEKTILLRNIRYTNGEVVADHLWFNYTKGFESADLEKPFCENDVIEFVARVKLYLKGYRGWREDVWKPVEHDYKLSHPTKISNLGQEDNNA